MFSENGLGDNRNDYLPVACLLVGVALRARPCGEMRVRSRLVRKTALDFYGSRAGWETRSPRDPLIAYR